MRFTSTLIAALLSGCGIYHVQPYTQESLAAPDTSDAATASSNCFEASTPAEKAACSDPQTGASMRAMQAALQADLRTADLFGRDALLANQRIFLLALPTICRLPATDAPADQAAQSCLAAILSSHAQTLAAWHPPQQSPIGANAITQYVHFRQSSGSPPETTPLCRALGQAADAALARTGTADPAAMPGATELAGSHGPDASAADPRHRIAVSLANANVFGSYQHRARTITLDGAPTPAIDSLSLGRALQSAAENRGSRFSAYASQTGDYGSIDVFTFQNRLLALVADTWGFDTPAAPGEFAHAGTWDLSGPTPQLACLYDTFEMPAENGDFEKRQALSAWRATLTQIRDSAQLPLGVSALRDQSQLQAEATFMVLNMPLVVTQQARTAGWTPWLRQRHDSVLDALFAWSARDPANKPLFDAAFAQLRPAAQDLVAAYQQTQALNATEAREAAGLAIMELLYGATINLAPRLDGDLHAPLSAAGYRPRYPILAAPQ